MFASEMPFPCFHLQIYSPFVKVIIFMILFLHVFLKGEFLNQIRKSSSVKAALKAFLTQNPGPLQIKIKGNVAHLAGSVGGGCNS